PRCPRGPAGQGLGPDAGRARRGGVPGRRAVDTARRVGGRGHARAPLLPAARLSDAARGARRLHARDRLSRDRRRRRPATRPGLAVARALAVLTDSDLYRRGTATLLASWEEYARGAAGAEVRRFPGVP